MATVKQCDCCGKIYTPDSKKTNEFRFRVSDTEPSLHVLDLCYDCLAKLETLMGGRKHTPGWKNQTHIKSATSRMKECTYDGTPVDPPVLSGMPVPKGETKVNVVISSKKKDDSVTSLLNGVNGLYRPEAAPCCCCETGLENAVTYDPVTNRTASEKMTNPIQTSMNGKETE